jgi:curved DNA-binding protein CbpA
METAELSRVATMVLAAGDYLGVFGVENKGSAQTKRVYRDLAKVLHPDQYHNDSDRGIANDAFAKLGTFYDQTKRAHLDGTYGQPVLLATVTTRRARHDILSVLATGDIGTVYRSQTTTSDGELATVCKVASSAGDGDLMQTEALALKRLRADGTDQTFHPYLPLLVDAFAYHQAGTPRRQATVTNRFEGFYTLRQVREAFPTGLNPLDMAWIWRRLLVALGFAHQNGVIHGAVLPDHIMVLPEQHGLVLVDWCYASLNDDGNHPVIKAIVDRYRPWYPEEVTAKQSPTPATDIALAARCMVELLGGDPVTGNLPAAVPPPMRAFFRGCLTTRQAARPQDAWQLLQEFDELLELLGNPYYPRRFRPFTMPSGVVS